MEGVGRRQRTREWEDGTRREWEERTRRGKAPPISAWVQTRLASPHAHALGKKPLPMVSASSTTIPGPGEPWPIGVHLHRVVLQCAIERCRHRRYCAAESAPVLGHLLQPGRGSPVGAAGLAWPARGRRPKRLKSGQCESRIVKPRSFSFFASSPSLLFLLFIYFFTFSLLFIYLTRTIKHAFADAPMATARSNHRGTMQPPPRLSGRDAAESIDRWMVAEGRVRAGLEFENVAQLLFSVRRSVVFEATQCTRSLTTFLPHQHQHRHRCRHQQQHGDRGTAGSA